MGGGVEKKKREEEKSLRKQMELVLEKDILRGLKAEKKGAREAGRK